MHWDDFLIGENKELRQLTVGTISGTYIYQIRKEMRDLHCQDERSSISPATGRKFLVETRRGKAGYQVNRLNRCNDVIVNSNELGSIKRSIPFL